LLIYIILQNNIAFITIPLLFYTSLRGIGMSLNPMQGNTYFKLSAACPIPESRENRFFTPSEQMLKLHFKAMPCSLSILRVQIKQFPDFTLSQCYVT